MISIYNETKNAWKINELSEYVIRFMKTKQRTLEDGSTRKRLISVISYTRLFEDKQKLNQQLAKAKLTDVPVVLTDKQTGIIFNNKEFKPIITGDNKFNKNILFGSIFLKGRKIINVRNDSTFLLEFFMFGAEFSFITSFNTKDASFGIILLDERTNVVTEYEITQVDGKFVVETSERAVEEDDLKSNFRVRVFRPSRPTNVILAFEDEIPYIPVDLERYRIIPITHEGLDAVIKDLVDRNFKAVTLYVNTAFRKESEEERKKYGRVIGKLKPKFQTVFKMHTGGKIDKVQF